MTPQDAGVDTGSVVASDQCSESSDVEVDVTMHNTFSDRSVDIFWVGFDCKEHLWETVEPGSTAGAGSFATHVWRFRNPTTSELYKEAVIEEGLTDIYVP